jgi:amino acid transporter
MALAVTLSVLLVYILVAVAGTVFFWRERRGAVRYGLVPDVILPLVAILICGYTVVRTMYPRPPAPAGYAPWVVLIWLGIGLAVAGWLRVARPDRVERFGTILAESDAADEHCR